MLDSPDNLPDWLDPEVTTLGDDAIYALKRREIDGGDVLAIKIGDDKWVETDMGAPEDATFNRDWGWVPQIIRRAYEQGCADERARAAKNDY